MSSYLRLANRPVTGEFVVVVARSQSSIAHAVEDRGGNDDRPPLALLWEIATVVELRRASELKQAILPVGPIIEEKYESKVV